MIKKNRIFVIPDNFRYDIIEDTPSIFIPVSISGFPYSKFLNRLTIRHPDVRKVYNEAILKENYDLRKLLGQIRVIESKNQYIVIGFVSVLAYNGNFKVIDKYFLECMRKLKFEIERRGMGVIFFTEELDIGHRRSHIWHKIHLVDAYINDYYVLSYKENSFIKRKQKYLKKEKEKNAIIERFDS